LLETSKEERGGSLIPVLRLLHPVRLKLTGTRSSYSNILLNLEMSANPTKEEASTASTASGDTSDNRVENPKRHPGWLNEVDNPDGG
jgi:hypothetical protein